ncbi:hypothetical protein [Afifella sp. IM 167]|uniref:hypothetical protein n=1 Tax=Afifella sp. IM 167 TaxID=2033586 RepID=UPI001CC90F22|nr:hypothetical protein [Afifella sp. IM 167]
MIRRKRIGAIIANSSAVEPPSSRPRRFARFLILLAICLFDAILASYLAVILTPKKRELLKIGAFGGESFRKAEWSVKAIAESRTDSVQVAALKRP